jgi:sugar-specific transcriptional regulator TrmB
LRRGHGPDDDVVSRLRELGLNLYESRAYLALVRGGQLTAKGVGQAALIPQSRTYDVLESLKARGFAISTPSSPKVYTPIPYDRILPAHFEAKKEEIQARVSKVHEEEQLKLERLTDAYSRLREELGESVRQVSSVSEPVWMLEGRENIERMVVTLTQGARKELMRITRPPELVGDRQFDPFYTRMANWKHTIDAAERGVRVRWLSLTRELPSYPGLNVKEPPERRYFQHEGDIVEKFVLADGGNVLLNLYDPRLSAFGSVAMLMKSEEAYGVFREHFEAMWERAETLADVLPRVKNQVLQACERMKEAGFTKPEVALYRALAQSGASTQQELVEGLGRRVTEAEANKAFSKLLEAGTIYRNRALGLYMVEIPGVVIDMLDGKGFGK